MGTLGPRYILFGYMDPYMLNPIEPLHPYGIPLKEPLKDPCLGITTSPGKRCVILAVLHHNAEDEGARPVAGES